MYNIMSKGISGKLINAVYKAPLLSGIFGDTKGNQYDMNHLVNIYYE